MEYEEAYWIQLAQDKIQCQALVNIVITSGSIM